MRPEQTWSTLSAISLRSIHRQYATEDILGMISQDADGVLKESSIWMMWSEEPRLLRISISLDSLRTFFAMRGLPAPGSRHTVRI